MKIGDKYFLNLQEAVAWLLANNALPFQCNVNYVANTEIAKSAIINPSPNEIKVGALVLFADSKVGTISGLTSNGFMVGPEYTDIKTALNYITDVSVNASGNLIVTFSDGTTYNAGLIKQVSNFSIDASQHLIANYNDGTSTDLGSIFNGNVNIAGNFTADSIIENMTGYEFRETNTSSAITNVYASCVKNGNKITFVVAGYVESATQVTTLTDFTLGDFFIPSDIGNNLYPMLTGLPIIDYRAGVVISTSNVKAVQLRTDKIYAGQIQLKLRADDLDANVQYAFRYEVTFLLSANMLP